MKKLLLLLLVILLTVTSCGTVKSILQKKADVNVEKINVVSQLAYATDVSLEHSNVPIAKVFNKKIESVVGLPEVKEMVNIETNVAKTNVAFLDAKLEVIQTTENKIDKQIEADAGKAKALTEELGSYKSYFGLGAIFLGAKQLLFTGIWTILGVGLLFLILRLLAASNPIANLFFGIFQSVIASVIHLLEHVVPGSIKVVEEAKQEVNKIISK